MADATVLAIVIPGGVSALAIAGNVYVSRSSAQYAQRLADKEAARTLLDEAAQLLHEVGYAIDDALSKYLTHAEDFRAEADKGEDAFRKIEKLGHEIDRMVVRLDTRVGPDHAAAKHFRAANQAVLNIYGKLSTPRQGAGDYKHWEELDTEQTEFSKRAAAFVKAAHIAAGVQLPGKKTDEPEASRDGAAPGDPAAPSQL